MASEQKKKNSIPTSDPDNVVQIPLSDYAKRLDGKVRERYPKKISTIGIDPTLIEGKHFEPDCLPPVESTDLLCCLVLETSNRKRKWILKLKLKEFWLLTLNLISLQNYHQRGYVWKCALLTITTFLLLGLEVSKVRQTEIRNLIGFRRHLPQIWYPVRKQIKTTVGLDIWFRYNSDIRNP